jgi:hypothetical protein
MASFKCKDIVRASNLSLLGVSNSHVEKGPAKDIEQYAPYHHFSWLEPLTRL